MAQRGGYQIPENLHPEGRLCVQFEIPNDLFYIANFWGAIGELAKWTSYQRTGDDSGVQAANVMAEVIDLARESFLSGCEGDAPPDPEIIEVVKYILLNNSEDDSDGCEDDNCMCVKCGTAVHYDVESKKKYILDANCNKVYIDEPASSPDLAGVDDWVDAGQPSLPADLMVPHDNPQYQHNTEAQKCAKATAIVEEMWNLLSVHTALEAGMNFAAMVQALIAWAAVQFPAAVPANLAAAWAGFITSFISTIGLSTINEEMEPIYENTDAKSDIICQIVDKMIAPEPADFSWFGDVVSLPVKVNVIYASDVKAALDVFKTMFPDAKFSQKWLGLFPLSSWREVVSPKIPETLCGCEDYAPVDPLEGMGRIEWYATRALDYTATDPDPDGGSGFNPEEIIAFEASEGGDAENIDDDSWRSVLSFNGVNRGLGLIFKTPADVRITKVSFAAALEGATPPGTILHAGYFSATEAGSWTTELKRNNLVPGEFPFPLVEFPGLAGCHYFYFSFVILGGDETTNIRLDNIKFDIAADDGTWTRTGVKAEQLFPL